MIHHCLLSVIITLLCLNSAWSAPQPLKPDPGWIHHNGPCTQQCTPQGNMTINECGWYTSESEHLPENPEDWVGLDFLIPNYGFAASCACSGDKDPSWLSPTAECVRNYLHHGHQNLANATKIAWRAAKKHWDGEIRWIELALDPIYDMHMAAYKHCCCPHNIAPKPDWVCTFLGGKFLFCNLIVDAIELFGYCGCDGW